MVEAAAAWDRQASCLAEEAAHWRALTSTLTVDAVHAAAPYVAWLSAAATEAARAAAQATAAASAHEAALAAMVPREVIRTNRAKLVALATTNYLGQKCAMIADTEAEYEKMWATDVDAIYGYSRASAEASSLTPFGSPPPAAGVPGLADQDAEAAGQSWALESAAEVVSFAEQVMAVIPKALQGLLSSPQESLEEYLSSVTTSLSQLSSLSERPGSAVSNLNCLNRAAILQKTARLMFRSPN